MKRFQRKISKKLDQNEPLTTFEAKFLFFLFWFELRFIPLVNGDRYKARLLLKSPTSVPQKFFFLINLILKWVKDYPIESKNYKKHKEDRKKDGGAKLTPFGFKDETEETD